jgi:osmotically-inducible protein OsmY
MKTNARIEEKMNSVNEEPLIKQAEPGIAAESAIASLKAYCNELVKKFTNDVSQLANGMVDPREIQSDCLVPDGRPTNAEIKENVTRLLKSYTSLNYEKIKINVNDGFVTLSGVVEWDFVQEPLINSIEHLEGVAGVSLRMIAFK